MIFGLGVISQNNLAPVLEIIYVTYLFLLKYLRNVKRMNRYEVTAQDLVFMQISKTIT